MDSILCRIFAISIALFLILWVGVNGDICDQCVCPKFECESVTKICSTNEVDIICDGKNEKLRKTNQSFNLETIQWPRRNITISAKLNYLNVTHLPKLVALKQYQTQIFNIFYSCNLLTAYRLLCTAPATSLSFIAINFDDNLIEYIAKDTFQFCPDLTHISLARNKINRLSSGLFRLIKD